ncbi:MAG: tetratricopeptide repeat protein [Treponema sp.]|nr:tetratricopeptide repeat protein [Treponema sp.]
MIFKGSRRAFIFFSMLIILSCKTPPQPLQERIDTSIPTQPAETHYSSGLADEIRNLTETGILSSMLQAIELIRVRELSNSDFGRMMTGINVLLIRYVYPDSLARLPAADLPLTFNYTRIIREAERGILVRPDANSTDFFELILPALAINNTSTFPAYFAADLQKAGELKRDSVLPPFFRGLVLERLNRHDEAVAAYRQAYQISNECYSAQIGIARIRIASGNPEEAVTILADLVTRFPDSVIIKRQLALAYFGVRDWQRALTFIDGILHIDPRDGDFLLMKASILIEQQLYPQANTTLDSYVSINPNNRSYLFMRARVQSEGNRNRDSALNYLRSILRSNPNDEEAMTYAVNLLMESQRPADLTEGRELLERLRQLSGSSIDVLSLSLRDAINRESWQEAQGFLNRILAIRRTDQDLIDGYYIESGLRSFSRALTYARELYERNTSNNTFIYIYISALIDNNRRDEASRLLENRINSAAAGTVKSGYYFLRSRLQANTDDALGDLRSSLFEDPRNLDAIIAMFEIYHNRREERRAVHYLRQALAISPNHPRLRRYEQEYASLLGRN